MATSFTTHSAGQVIESADINLIQTAVNALENAPAPVADSAKSGFSAWAFDPAYSSSQSMSATAGVVYATALYIPAGTVTNIHAYVTILGSTTHLAMGLYTAAGALLSQTADQTSGGGSTGLKTYALGTPQVVAAGYYYVAVAGAGAAVSWLGGNNSTSGITNAQGASPPTSFRVAQSGTAYSTTMPSPLGTLAATSKVMLWVAVS